MNMKYKNNTEKGIKVPVKSEEANKPVNWVTAHPGDEVEIPTRAENSATLLGLDKVEAKAEVKVEKPKKEKKAKKEKPEVKAVESSIGKAVVETKVVEEPKEA